MSTATPFIVLPSPSLKNARFEYRIADLINSFEVAGRLAQERMSAFPEESPVTLRQATLSEIFLKSSKIVKLLLREGAHGNVIVSAASMITDGVRPKEDGPNNTFLAQIERNDIEFMAEEYTPA